MITCHVSIDILVVMLMIIVLIGTVHITTKCCCFLIPTVLIVLTIGQTNHTISLIVRVQTIIRM